MSYSLYTHGHNNNNNNNHRETLRMTDTEIVDIYPSKCERSETSMMGIMLTPYFVAGKKKGKKAEQTVAPVITLEMPD